MVGVGNRVTIMVTKIVFIAGAQVRFIKLEKEDIVIAHQVLQSVVQEMQSLLFPLQSGMPVMLRVIIVDFMMMDLGLLALTLMTFVLVRVCFRIFQIIILVGISLSSYQPTPYLTLPRWSPLTQFIAP